MSDLAQMARTEARKLVRELRLGCGDNSCYFRGAVSGMGTNGGCRCAEKIQDVIERVAEGYRVPMPIPDDDGEVER